MESLRKDQVEIKTLLQSDAMVKMMKSIKRPPTGTGKRGQPEK